MEGLCAYACAVPTARLRILIVPVAAAAVVFGVARLHKDNRCEQTRKAIVGSLFHRRYPQGGLALQQRRLVGSCRDRGVLASVSVVETTAGLRGPAASLARTIVRDEPSNARGWAVLAQALAGGDPHGAAVARARFHALNPRGQVPVALRGRAPLRASPR